MTSQNTFTPLKGNGFPLYRLQKYFLQSVFLCTVFLETILIICKNLLTNHKFCGKL